MSNRTDTVAACRRARAATAELNGYLAALESCASRSGGHAIPEDHAMIRRKYEQAAGALADVSVKVEALLAHLEVTS